VGLDIGGSALSSCADGRARETCWDLTNGKSHDKGVS
jgi:hypothetical protein